MFAYAEQVVHDFASEREGSSGVLSVWRNAQIACG
jgi:hypothetical protein